jgi:hypothetical protein
MLWSGQFESKVLAALCLGEIGDERALPKLEGLSLAAEMDLPKGYVENPFAAPIEKIRRRIRDDSEKRETIADANEGREADVNETPEVELPGQAKGVLELLVVNRETKEPLAQVKLSIAIHKDGPDEERAKVTDQRAFGSSQAKYSDSQRRAR